MLPNDTDQEQKITEFLKTVEGLGLDQLYAERAAAKSLGDKIWITLKIAAFHIAGFFILPIKWAIKFGTEAVMDHVGSEMHEKINVYLDNKVEKGEMGADQVAEVKELLGEASGEADAIIGFAMYMIMGPFIGTLLQPWADLLGHKSANLARQTRIIPIEAVTALFRGSMTIDQTKDNLADLGYRDDQIQNLIDAYRAIPKEGDFRDLFLRKFDSPETAKANLERMGYSEEDADSMLKLFWAVPPLADMVRFADFSAFDPDVIARWKEFFDLPGWLQEPFAKVGIKDEEPDLWGSRYWFSHWRQPGRFELGDLHRRKLIGDDDARMAYKTMGYSGFWQENLLQLVRAIPTRVDVRRWWDMRTIDEARLREIYHSLGYYDQDLDDYVLWTKVYVAFPDLMARFTKGWITLDDVRSELTALGMPEDRVQEMIETKVKTEQPERTTKERDVTKAEIVKGVKKDVITREQANILLQEMGYDQAEAAFILAINIPEDKVDTVIRERELTKTDVLKGLKAAIIDRGTALQMLLDLRYTQADAAFLLAIYEAVAEGEKPPAEREATKADIIKGVRKGIIAPEQGYSMLLDIGYSHDAATFILSINVEAEAFSPQSYMEFLFLTRWYRTMLGKPANIPPNDLILAEKGYKEAKARHDTMVRAKASENEIAEAAIALVEAEYRYSQLLALWREKPTGEPRGTQA
ncbi:hypothetical protein ES707_20484 [subsurface metagenome]